MKRSGPALQPARPPGSTYPEKSELLKGPGQVAPTFYAFNATRQYFLSLAVKVADTPMARLRGFLGRARLHNDEAIWVVPSQGIHTFGLLFPIDVIYLDKDFRVIEAVEHLVPFRIGPLRTRCASVLELPPRTIYCSNTQTGDQMLICSPEEMSEYWNARRQKPVSE